MKTMLKNAKKAKLSVSRLTTDEKNAALNAMADALLAETDAILNANTQDLDAARDHISPVMMDRLRLTPDRIAGMAQGIRDVAALPDPVGQILESHTREDGLKIEKVSVPMGVIAIIYESRPNVTSDAAALALKSSNVCVLRGGKDAFRSANAIVTALRSGLKAQGITEYAVNLVQDTSRDSATALMTANGYIDLLIPRGGAGLCPRRYRPLYRHRHRHLPRLCGEDRRSEHGSEYHRKRQNQPSQRLQRRGSAAP